MVLTDPGLNKYAGQKRFKLQSLLDPGKSMGHSQPIPVNGQFSELLNSAIARSTWAKYSSGFHAFCNFESASGRKYSWPLSREVWRSFIVWCHYEKKLSPNSIRTYLSALKFVHTLRGFSCSHLDEDKLSKLLLNGAEHLGTNFSNHHNTRRAMTLPLLLTLGRRIAATSWPALDKQVVWAAATTGFFGTLLLHLKNPKSGFPGGEKVDLFEFPGYDCCPVQALRNLRAKQIEAGFTAENLPVFRFSSGKNLTCSIMNKTLADLLPDFHVPGRDTISCHSFRAGIPSVLAMFPDLVTSDQIKGWGRWQSDCYQLYTRLSLLEKESIFEKIKSALIAVAKFQ